MTPEISSLSAEKVISIKPFPWPIWLAAAVFGGCLGFFVFIWYQQNYALFLRLGWICLCSVFPGLSLMIILGSLAQIRHHRFLSWFSMVLAAMIFISCCGTIFVITKNVDFLLK